MEPEKNPFVEALSRGRVQFGCWLSLPDNSVVEIAALAGFDWLLIDHEHGPLELTDILSLLQTLAPYDVAPIVRPASDDGALIKKLLDTGAQTLVVPMVNSPEQAARLVSAVRYPPAGTRGLAPNMVRASRWSEIQDYARQANDHICLIVQAETVEAMERLTDIASVDGVDGVFIGPADLAASMGYPGNSAAREVVDVIQKGLKTIGEAGKYAGVLCMDPTLAKTYIQAGADFVGITIDVLLLLRSMKEAVQTFRNLDREEGK